MKIIFVFNSCSAVCILADTDHFGGDLETCSALISLSSAVTSCVALQVRRRGAMKLRPVSVLPHTCIIRGGGGEVVSYHTHAAGKRCGDESPGTELNIQI